MRSMSGMGIVSPPPNIVMNDIHNSIFMTCPAGKRAIGGGGAGIFRPKNPEAKRSTNPSKPVVRSNRPTRPNPAEVEEKFEDALAAGNDARDARKFSVAEASYRSALALKPRDARVIMPCGLVW